MGTGGCLSGGWLAQVQVLESFKVITDLTLQLGQENAKLAEAHYSVSALTLKLSKTWT